MLQGYNQKNDISVSFEAFLRFRSGAPFFVGFEEKKKEERRKRQRLSLIARNLQKILP
jgi:hypothetical protein